MGCMTWTLDGALNRSESPLTLVPLPDGREGTPCTTAATELPSPMGRGTGVRG